MPERIQSENHIGKRNVLSLDIFLLPCGDPAVGIIRKQVGRQQVFEVTSVPVDGFDDLELPVAEVKRTPHMDKIIRKQTQVPKLEINLPAHGVHLLLRRLFLSSQHRQYTFERTEPVSVFIEADNILHRVQVIQEVIELAEVIGQKFVEIMVGTDQNDSRLAVDSHNQQILIAVIRLPALAVEKPLVAAKHIVVVFVQIREPDAAVAVLEFARKTGKVDPAGERNEFIEVTLHSGVAALCQRLIRSLVDQGPVLLHKMLLDDS